MKKTLFFFVCGIVLILTNYKNLYSIIEIYPILPYSNQLKISDLVNINLRNITNEQQSLTLKIEINDLPSGLNIANITSSPFIVNPGFQNLKNRLNKKINFESKDSRILKSLEKTGSFPDGQYYICIELYNEETNELVDRDCISQSIATSLPPILLTPVDNSEITQKLIIWSWYIQGKVSSGNSLTYDLKVVEILSFQTPDEAMNSNPAVIVAKDLTSCVWQTDITNR